MNYVDLAEQIINCWNEIGCYLKELRNKLSYYDRSIAELRHLKEFNEITKSNAFKISNKEKEVYIERRKIKEEICKVEKIYSNILSFKSKEDLEDAIKNIEDKQNDKVCEYRTLTEKEIEKLLK